MKSALLRWLLAGVSLAVAHPAAAAADEALGLPAGNDAQFRQRMLAWTAAEAAGRSSDSLLPPVEIGRLSSPFGSRADPLTRAARRHAGIDVPGLTGTPVRAAADGIVTVAGWAGGYGNLVRLDHGNGLETRYAHLHQIDVVPGMTVHRGDVLGLVGSTGRSTGSHLHFEVRVDGAAADPVGHLDGTPGAATLPARVVEPRWGGWSTAGLPSSVLK